MPTDLIVRGGFLSRLVPIFPGRQAEFAVLLIAVTPTDIPVTVMMSSVGNYRTAIGWNRFGNYQGKY